MKKTLIFLAMLAASASSIADTRLVGKWASADAELGALPGTLELQKGGKLLMQPEGFDLASGTWVVDKKLSTLTLTLDGIGSSDMGYRFVNKHLELTYDNGNRQLFKKAEKSAAVQGAKK